MSGQAYLSLNAMSCSPFFRFHLSGLPGHQPICKSEVVLVVAPATVILNQETTGPDFSRAAAMSPGFGLEP